MTEGSARVYLKLLTGTRRTSATASWTKVSPRFGRANMTAIEKANASQTLRIDSTDLEVRAQVAGTSMTIQVMKAGACVHQLTIGDACQPMEHTWIADLFARDDHIELASLVRDADDYISNLDINQG
jgi:hypothetical protein